MNAPLHALPRIQVGFIGLGNIGGPMAVHIAKAGFQLVVHDVRQEALQQVLALGAMAAISDYELAQRSDIVMIAVVNDIQLEEVVLGKGTDQGVLAGCAPGSIIVIHSTVHPDTCRKLGKFAAERGVGVVDAPVSGGDMAAHAGTLSLMMGGDAAHVAACMPVFEVISANRHHVGGVGAGATAKLANNLVAMINLEATREGLRLARLSGISEDTMLEILKVSTGNNWMVQNWEARRSNAANYSAGSGGIGKVRYKDLMLALELGSKVGATLPVTALVTQFTQRESND